jgi:hypothetical protein
MESETQLRQIQATIRRIRDYNRQYASAILWQALKTVLPGLAVLLGLAVVSAYVIGYLDAAFGNRLVTSAASAITFLLTLLAARAIWQWADRRYRGWTLIRTVGQVNSVVRHLERDIARSRGGQVTGGEWMAAQAQSAWESHSEAMRQAGFSIE